MSLWRILAFSLALLSPGLAVGWSEHWTAISRTALAITGDVVLRTDRIGFANGQSLSFTKLHNMAFKDDAGRQQAATLYRITQPRRLVLLEGNEVCGSAASPAPVTFIAIWRTRPMLPGEPVGRALAVFSGRDEPTPDMPNGCATFFYKLAR